MVVKDLKRGKICSIGTSSDSRWIANQKSGKLPGLEFTRISSWLFKSE
jgi:hypothetical protein